MNLILVETVVCIVKKYRKLGFRGGGTEPKGGGGGERNCFIKTTSLA